MQALRLAALSAIVLYACSAAGPVVRDIEGRQVSPISKGISVLLFTRTDCPISNRYAPEMIRLYNRFRPVGVRFHIIYVDPAQPVAAVRTHLRNFGYPFEALMDVRHELVRFTGVKITPEVAVYANERLIYRGRIDNTYVSAGTSRPAPTTRDLKETLVKAIEGQPLEFHSEPAVGCFIEDLR